MPRKPSETVQVNLRIKESLRRRLENAARKRQVSLNYEMTSLLERGLDQPALLEGQNVAQDMAIMWARWGDAFTKLNRQADLMVAAERLVGSLGGDPQDIRQAASGVIDVLRVIKLEGSLLPERLNTADPAAETTAGQPRQTELAAHLALGLRALELRALAGGDSPVEADAPKGDLIEALERTIGRGGRNEVETETTPPAGRQQVRKGGMK